MLADIINNQEILAISPSTEAAKGLTALYHKFQTGKRMTYIFRSTYAAESRAKLKFT